MSVENLNNKSLKISAMKIEKSIEINGNSPQVFNYLKLAKNRITSAFGTRQIQI